ncbi:MAG TPA: AarF/ABC1/UbiB kinase family protein [Candidatus Nanoarchaeia archaeon]|nr:AarF/ABC1/UbiB kinase family protein [Candidatus Nanoarchaeia archaeon]
MGFKQAFNDVDRIRHVVAVLLKYELGFFVDKLGLKGHLTFGERFNRTAFQKVSHLNPGKLRKAFEELGGGFVKLGQLLSLRPDLIPKEYCEEFSKLQDSMNGFDFVFVKEVIEQEYGKPLNNVFMKFESKPLAAASIGQVHKAWLKNGKKVAVKVKRPHIEKVFDADIDILKRIVRIIEHHYPELKEYNVSEIAKEFERYTRDELDYLAEARNIELFYKSFSRNSKVKIPKVYHEFTTKNVLVMEYIDGEKLNEAKHYNKNVIVKEFMDAIMEQILEHNIFHADPHPGNLLILKDNRIAFLDFGIVGRINKELQEKVQNVFIALSYGDRDKLADAFIEIGFLDENVDKDRLKEDLSVELGRFYDVSLQEIQMKEFVYHVLNIARKYHMKFPGNFVLLLKSMATAEGLCKEIDPGFKYIEAWKLRARKLEGKRMSFSYAFGNVRNNIYGFRKFFDDVPGNFRKLFIGRDHLQVEINDKDIKKFTFKIDNAITRVAYGVVIAGLIVSSAFIAAFNKGNGLLGIPYLAIVYLAIAIILGIFLVNSIQREKGGV